jgi:hypothetical protein
MSGVFEAPQISEAAVFKEPSNLQWDLDFYKRLFSRTVATLALTAVSVLLNTSMVMANTGGYPDADAVDCSATHGVGSWCKGDPARPNSPRGYGYRNCTDWAAWRVPQLGVGSVPNNLRDAEDWDTNVPGDWIKDQVPEPGDIAHSEANHVGVVEKVTKNAQGHITSIEVSEYNKARTGSYSWHAYTPDANGVFWRGSGKKWDKFLDLNGTGKGIAEPQADKAVTAISSQITPDRTTHVYWADRTGKLKESWFRDGVKHTNVIKDFGITDVTEISSQFTGSDALQHVYAGTSGGEIWEFWFGPNSGGYQGRLIIDADSEVTALSSMITRDGFHRVYWATQNRQLYETWYGNGQNGGTYVRDTSNSHMQAITSQYTTDGTRRIYWGNDEGRLHERRINDASTELRLMADFPEKITSLASLTTPDGQQHIYSGDDSGQIRETWFNVGGSYNTWPVRNLGSAVLAISGAYTSHDGLQHIYAGSATGNLSEIWFGSGRVDGRPIPLSPAPSRITALSSQYTPDDRAQHLYWGAPDGVVRETWFGPTGADTWNLPTSP